MAKRDYEIGFGKPPKNTMFKPNTSGNPKGRPPGIRSEISEIIDAFLDAPIEFREGGRMRVASRFELNLKLMIKRAVAGDIKAADQLAETFIRAQRNGEGGTQRLVVSDWLPDFEGQTAENKARDAKTDQSASALTSAADDRVGPSEKKIG